MNKLIFITLLILTFSIDKSESERFAFQLFQKFIIKYNKQYNSVAEYLLRFNIFKKNLERFSQNKSSYKIGINQFTDLTQTEFRKNYLNLDMKLLNKIHNKKVSIQKLLLQNHGIGLIKEFMVQLKNKVTVEQFGLIL